MPERSKITSNQRATWACVIIHNGRRGANRKDLMVGYLGPRKDHRRTVALCTGEIVGSFHVDDLRGRKLRGLFFAHINSRGIKVAEPTEDEKGRTSA